MSRELLRKLLENHLQLSSDGEHLDVRSPAGPLPTDMRAQLIAGKQSLLRLLKPGCIYASVSQAQRRLWFLDRLGVPSEVYTIAVSVRLDGNLDREKLRESVVRLADRQQALRTSFSTVDGLPVQIFDPGMPIELDEIAADEGNGRSLESWLSVPWDLTRGPLFRAVLRRTNDREHRLVVCVHHIIADGWSTGVIARDLAALYSRGAEDARAELEPLRLQFRDFACFENASAPRRPDESTEYWRKQLFSPLPVLSLPSDRRRAGEASYRGGSVRLDLDAGLVLKLQEVARSEGVTLFMLLLAAYKVLLYRYTGQADVILGAPVAGREAPDSQRVIGCFARTLVLRTDVSGDPAMREVLARVRQTVLEAQEYELPLERVVEIAKPDRSRGHNPLFQHMFAFQGAREAKLEFPGIRATVEPVVLDRSAFDSVLRIERAWGGVVCVLQYDVDRLTPATSERMLGSFATLLESIVTDLAAPVGRLCMVRGEELRRAVESQVGTTEASVPAHRCAHELFETCVDRDPDAPAVADAVSSLSYGELEARANRLAHHLRRKGVGREHRVGVCVSRGVELVCAILGILKAGGAYVPLDASTPKRAERIAEDAGLAWVVAERATAGALAGLTTERLFVDEIGPELERESSARPAPVADASSLVYVYYTSGSQGMPKGVAIEHRSLCNFIESQVGALGIGPRDRTAQLAHIGFDAAVWEIFSSLATGGTLCIPSADVASSPARLATYLRVEEISVLFAVPSMLSALPDGEYPKLRLVATGAERSSAALVERWAPGRAFYNAYGPTEATVWVSIARCTEAEPGDPPIGRAIPNARLYVLDSHLAPVPRGVVGELCIGGTPLARGYTQGEGDSHFVEVAVRGRPERVFRTGDLVRQREDGSLAFVGRADDQLKVRGVRIERGEIESVLEEHPDVEKAVVVLQGTGADARLVAYVVAAAGRSVDASRLREDLRNHLPSYMTPSVCVPVDDLPLGPTGKIDRKQLPPIDLGSLPARCVAGRDPVELSLVRVWEELFERSPIGVQDNFFDLGGHSMLAARLMARIEEELDVALPLVEIFERPTIESLAAALRGGAETSRPCLVLLNGARSGTPLFCVHSATGTAFSYAALARAFGADRPLYAFEAPGLDGRGVVLDSVSEQAALYLNEIKRERPCGPYAIAGHSSGAAVAFEIARRLADTGDEVEFVGIIDTAAPFPGLQQLYPLVHDDLDDVIWLSGLLTITADFFGVRAPVSVGELASESEEGRFSYALERLRRFDRVAPGMNVSMIRNALAVIRANALASRTYTGGFYEGTVTLIRSREPFEALPPGAGPAVARALARAVLRNPVGFAGALGALGALCRAAWRRRSDPTRGWRDYCRHVELCDVAGNHVTVLVDPHVSELAAALGGAKREVS